MSYYVYILLCADDTLYTGYTTDLSNREAAHNQGLGAKYTRGRTPVRIVYQEAHLTKADALKREWAIKQLSRAEKMRLIGPMF